MKKIITALLLISTLTSQAGWLDWFTPKQDSWFNWKTIGVGAVTFGGFAGILLFRSLPEKQITRHKIDLQNNNGFIYEGMEFKPIIIKNIIGTQVAEIKYSKCTEINNSRKFHFIVNYKDKTKISTMFIIDPSKK